MSQDPLTSAGFTLAARHDAEYDAIYAAVTATERGRWFLSEYADRNRAATTDAVVAALSRIEAALNGLAPRSQPEKAIDDERDSAGERNDIATPAAKAPAPSEADDVPRWHIDGPDFLVRTAARQPEPEPERIKPASPPEQQQALLPQTLFQPRPGQLPASLFDGNATLVVSAATAPGADAVRNQPPLKPQPAALRVVTGTVVHSMSFPASNEPRGTIRHLSQEELIALFG